MMVGVAVDMNDAALIVFVRNPKLGKVKTRLAKGIGDEKALAVYQLLLKHTRQIITGINCRKFIYYADNINPQDIWDNTIFEKRLQSGEDLGERMGNAFKELFDSGFKKVLIIGSDCYQLQAEIIQEAINFLDNYSVVMGPTFDGGYYLLGMNQLIPKLFIDKPWSTDKVALRTIRNIDQLGLSFKLLKRLHDVDEPEDLVVNGIIV